MKQKVYLVARLLLGLNFFVFGLNGFFNFMPAPPPMPEGAQAYLGGLMAAGYFFPVLKFTEVVCGLALLSGFFAPLALIILAPITIQIFLFHFFLTPGQWTIAAVIFVVHLVAARGYWDRFRPLLQPR